MVVRTIPDECTDSEVLSGLESILQVMMINQDKNASTMSEILDELRKLNVYMALIAGHKID